MVRSQVIKSSRTVLVCFLSMYKHRNVNFPSLPSAASIWGFFLNVLSKKDKAWIYIKLDACALIRGQVKIPVCVPAETLFQTRYHLHYTKGFFGSIKPGSFCVFSNTVCKNNRHLYKQNIPIRGTNSCLLPWQCSQSNSRGAVHTQFTVFSTASHCMCAQSRCLQV